MKMVFLLFLVTAAFATPSVYVVTGFEKANGAYEKKKNDENEFEKLGGMDNSGNYWFLYSSDSETWVIGTGQTRKEAQVVLRAPSKAGPPVTQWSYVNEGSPEPSVRVVGLETDISGEEVLRQLEGGEDVVTKEYIICRCSTTTESSQPRLIISKSDDDPFYCYGFAQCESRADENCTYVTVKDKSKKANIVRNTWETKTDSVDDKGNIVCRSPGNQEWWIIDRNDCRGCNKINDCATGLDEKNCPAFVSPSFELPFSCCLIVLILGILFHLGWKAVTRTVEDEAREMETIGNVGRQLEEAVDLIIQAAIEELPFPEDSYTIVHDHCGGVDMLIGTRHGKSSSSM